MAKKAPGQNFRIGMSLMEVCDIFPDDKTAEEWFVQTRWPNGVICPHCNHNEVRTDTKHPKMPFRCKSCQGYFSAKTGTSMQSSKIGYRKWAIAIYLFATNIKGTSSMKLHRDIKVSQKTAWHMAHRIREAWANSPDQLSGVVEVDETFVGGKAKHMSRAQKEARGIAQGGKGKAIVAGAKERGSGHVVARVVEGRDRETLSGFVHDAVRPGSTVYTDDHLAYRHLESEGYPHEAVVHSAGEYVRGEVHTNGVEGFWALFKRGYKGTYHKMSDKHLQRYVNEFAGRASDRPSDTIDQMTNIARGLIGRRLKYNDLTADAPAQSMKVRSNEIEELNKKLKHWRMV